MPERLLVIGGGIIGLELATSATRSRITAVELTDALIPGCDPDLVAPLQKRIEERYEVIHLCTRVTGVKPLDEGLRVSFEGDDAPEPQLFDRVLVAVGRRPNGAAVAAERAGVHVDERGFIPVDARMRTNVPHILAIGDVVEDPMLAHKASHEGRVAAEVIAGRNVELDAHAIPSVAYTDPEVAWMRITETQAKADGIDYEVASFPWAASGRGRTEGKTKLLGAGMVGPSAGELIAETVPALEMGAEAEDVALTIHPHPTLSETTAFAAETAESTITDLYLPKKSAVR